MKISLIIPNKTNSIVLNTIKKLNKDRRCFRLVGTALVEHTIGDVQPTLQEHRDKVCNYIFVRLNRNY